MKTAAVIGGGPAGLMAAEVLAAGGVAVDVYDAMPSVGRKFLMAGKGGLNITHAESLEPFLARYGARQKEVTGLLRSFGPDELRAWVHGLGIETFVGTSGRVFPAGMKAAPLLRAWLRRLRGAGVRFHMRHRWTGWKNGAPRFITPDGEKTISPDAVILALGGGSWATLGSDGAWTSLLAEHGVAIAPLHPANCGFDTDWSDHFKARFAGQPVKPVVISFTDSNGSRHRRQGEFVISETGVEGSLIYALSALVRDTIAAKGSADIFLDLVPGKEAARIASEIAKPRGSNSMANHLRKHAGLTGVQAGLLRELLSKEDFNDPRRLGAAVKALPLTLLRPRPLDEAISTAGGVRFAALDENQMLKKMPGVFCAGEMLDWEAPTGGYLLTACFAGGRAAGTGALAWLAKARPMEPGP